MWHGLRTILLPVGMQLLLGCEHGSFRIDIAIEKNRYVFNSGEQPRATLTNRSAQQVHRVWNDYVVERLQQGKWVAYRPLRLIDGPHVYSLAPGESSSIQLHDGYFRSADMPGTFRFHFLVYRDEELKQPFPLHQRLSESFEVVK